MADWLKRAGRFLRSRRLAIWLLLAAVALSVIGTLVPQTSVSADRELAWSAAHPSLEAIAAPLGLHALYSSPVFLAILAVIGASTAVCAWERTRWAWTASRPATVGDRLRERLRDAPHAAAEGDATVADARERLTSGLSRAGLRVRDADGVIVAGSGRVGAWGSPLFHWALAALFVVIALGQLTRAEGVIGIRVGDTASLEPARFGRWLPAPLYRGNASNVSLQVLRFERDHVTAGYSRGPSPYVRLSAGGEARGEQWVFPNNPLRYGTLLIHQDAYGVSPVVTALAPNGQVVGTTSGLSDWDDAAPDGVTPYHFTVDRGQGVPGVEVTVTLEAAREGTAVIRAIPPWKRVRVAVGETGSTASTTTELTPGRTVEVPGGFLRLDDVAYYARMTVVDDWSVYPIYGLFGLAIAGLVMALLLPLRTAFVLVEARGSGGVSARAIVRHRRGDPVFRQTVERVLAESVGAGAETDDGSQR